MPSYIAKTFHGLEPVLAEELRTLGVRNVLPLNRAVQFDANPYQLYRANISLRTALRILRVMSTGQVRTPDDLYRMTRRIKWHNFFDVNNTFAVRSVVRDAYNFSHSNFAALKVKDAIADHFREETGSRPFVDKDTPDVQIHVRLFRDQCTLMLDSSGEGLNRRGYRQVGHRAPLNEVLGAGMILLSGWDKESVFLDPMCGSGTLPIEAALIATNTSPNVHRERFGFEIWRDFNPSLLQKAKKDALEAQVDSDVRIYGSDISSSYIKQARNSIILARMEDYVRLSKSDFWERVVPKGEGVLICNPPYGDRLQVAKIENFYQRIGDHLKQHYAGYNAWVLSANLKALKLLGLRPSKKIQLFNGALECKFQKYELYKGSKEVAKK